MSNRQQPNRPTSHRQVRTAGATPRLQRPRPLSTRPPSVQNHVSRSGHEVYVQIANLQMAKARQERIQAALQDQVNRCAAEIDQINRRVQELFDKVGLTDASEGQSNAAFGDEGFEFKY